MEKMIQIGLIGDFSESVNAHRAIPLAISLAAGKAKCRVETTWVATNAIQEALLGKHHGLWCVPGSPYVNMDGALQAIRFAREQGIPFLGTCGGFQHAVLEYARNVLGLENADHVETNPDTAIPVISPLSCSHVGVEGSIRLISGTRIHRIYGKEETVERYHCNYGFNPDYYSAFNDGELRITGYDDGGSARVVEHITHRFYLATLFQPELSAFENRIHPVVSAFLEAVIAIMK